MSVDFSSIKNGNNILEGIKRGKYNLYLGAGATVSCKSCDGDFLLGEGLMEKIQRVFGKTARSLAQIAKIISNEQMNEILQSSFKTSEASKAIKLLPKYIWKRIFTLNVDDAIEFAYKSDLNAQQKLLSENFASPFVFESDKSKLQLVHLHGSILKPDDGYVFNVNEYMNLIKNSNTWLSVFTDIFSTDSFIMSGLSFNEMDVEYYLSSRTEKTQKPESYPSILIEPHPDDYIRSVCKERSLELVEATFDDFMEALSCEVNTPPTVYDLSNVGKEDFRGVSDKDRFKFFSDFAPIYFNENKTNLITRFDYGFEPDCLDIQSNKDITRFETKHIVNDILSRTKSSYGNLFLITGKYLNGKSTIALRVLKFLFEQGYSVFKLASLRGFDVENTVLCLKAIKSQFILYIDNLADYIYQASELLIKLPNVIIIGTERSYRLEHIRKVLVKQINEYNCDFVKTSESESLVNKYMSLGKVQNEKTLKDISILRGHAIGEQVCMILDSYKPIRDRISEFFSFDENQNDLSALLAVAICCHCYKEGANYYVIRGMLPSSYNFNKLFKNDSPFKLEFNPNDDDYVVPRNSLYFSELLKNYLVKDRKLLQNIYTFIYKKIALFVNRETIKKRTPESMLLARMLDVDKNVRYFFKNNEQSFMESIESLSKWNSRYWEQRALSLVDVDIDRALDFARQAVAIEFHPYPLTTLSKVIFAKMSKVDNSEKTMYCVEALERCKDAMLEEGRRRMESIQPIKTLMRGIESYMRFFSLHETIPHNLRQNIFSAIDLYEQIIAMTRSEHELLARIKMELK